MKKLFGSRYSDKSISFSLLIVSLFLGGLMISHGYQKLMSFGSGSAGFTDPFHIGGPASMILTIFAELFCAALVVLGLMTKIDCIPLIIAMSVSLFYSHHGQLFGDGEQAAVYLGGYVALLFSGPGKFSLEKLLGK